MPISKQAALKAAKTGDLPTIKQYLLERGDINIRDDEKRTMLDLLMDEPYEHTPEYAETILFLLKNGIDISQASDIGDDKWYLNAHIIHRAYLNGEDATKVFDNLLSREDIDVNARCDEGYHSESVHFGEITHPVKLDDGWVSKRAYEDGYILEDATLLHFAAIRGDADAIAKICNHPKVNINATASFIRNGHLLDMPALYYGVAERKGETDGAPRAGHIVGVWVCRTAIDILRVTNVTPLHLAARLGDKEAMQLLLKCKANPDAKDSDGRTPLDYLKDAIKEESIEEKNANNLIEVFKQVSIEEKSEKQSYKKRLLLGEGNFSFAKALVTKHAAKKQKLAAHITATEYSGLEELKKSHGGSLATTVDYLKGRGVSIFFGKDARLLHRDVDLTGQRFKRIHFNFPHDKSTFKARTLPKLLEDFFQSAAKVQEYGDRIHMALPKLSDARKDLFYQSYVYNIYQASAKAGYALIKKRRFGKNRYPGYEHVMTGESASTNVANDSREYVFVKTKFSYEEILKIKEYAPGGKYSAYGESNYYLENMPTDSGSSSYEEHSDQDDQREEKSTAPKSISAQKDKFGVIVPEIKSDTIQQADQKVATREIKTLSKTLSKVLNPVLNLAPAKVKEANKGSYLTPAPHQ